MNNNITTFIMYEPLYVPPYSSDIYNMISPSLSETKSHDIFTHTSLITQELNNYKAWSELQTKKLEELENKLKKAEEDKIKLSRKYNKLDNECKMLCHDNKRLKNDCKYFLNKFIVKGEPTKSHGNKICNYHLILGHCNLGTACYRGKHHELSAIESAEIIKKSEAINCRNESDSLILCSEYIVCPFKHSNTYDTTKCEIRKKNFTRLYNLAYDQKRYIF